MGWGAQGEAESSRDTTLESPSSAVYFWGHRKGMFHCFSVLCCEHAGFKSGRHVDSGHWNIRIWSTEVSLGSEILRVGAPGWLGRLSANFGSGQDLVVRGFEPPVGLHADSSEPGPSFAFCVSLSLCPSPVHALSLSVPKINKKH